MTGGRMIVLIAAFLVAGVSWALGYPYLTLLVSFAVVLYGIVRLGRETRRP